MRQKVSLPKNKYNERGARIQGDCASLAIPRRRRFAEPTPAFKGPAAPPGFRDSGNYNGYGVLWSVGTSGYSWSSTITSSNVRYLGLYYSRLRPQDSGGRAYGLQLRCLQEEGAPRHAKAGIGFDNYRRAADSKRCSAQPAPDRTAA